MGSASVSKQRQRCSMKVNELQRTPLSFIVHLSSSTNSRDYLRRYSKARVRGRHELRHRRSPSADNPFHYEGSTALQASDKVSEEFTQTTNSVKIYARATTQDRSKENGKNEEPFQPMAIVQKASLGPITHLAAPFAP